MSKEEQPPPTLPVAPPASPASAGQADRRHIDILDHAPHASPPVLPPPEGGIANTRAAVKHVVGYFGPALGNVFLIPSPWIGMVLWLALALTPRHAAFGLLGLGIAFVGQRALGLKEEAAVGGGLKANTLMAAVAAGWMTEPTIYPLQTQIGIAATTAVAAFIATGAIIRALEKTESPSLLWGYCLVAGTMFAIFPVGTMMASQQLTWWVTPPGDAAAWVVAFLEAIGMLMFAPTVAGGVIVACATLLWSRVALVTGVIGWVAGAIVAVNIQDLGVPYYWLPASHNFFVAGMAIGAFMILPAHSSLLLAGLAGAVASLFGIALQQLLPMFAYLPLASALTIWTGLGALALAVDRRGFWRNRWPRVSPEEAWWRDTLWSQRFGRGEPLFVVPVAGPLQIAQGFSGTLSHARRFRHALDFLRVPPQDVAVDDGNLAIANSIWNAAVTAPAAGTVEQVQDGIPDNSLGVSNFAETWGNCVSIRLDQGGWALLAHFRQWSIAVKPGMRVEIGTYLGAVGNSGRSPVPHLHLQAQAGPEPGARTIPFRLANYRSGPALNDPLLEWNAAKVPGQGTFVMHVTPNAAVHAVLASLSPGSSIWTVERRGTIPRSFRERRPDVSLEVRHTLDEWGRHRFVSGGSHLVAALASDAWRVVEQRGSSPLLRLLAHAAPSIPYAAEVGLAWSDLVPAMPVGLTRWIALATAPYRLRPFTYARAVCRMASGRRASDRLVIETVPAPRHHALPSKVVCTFVKVRGPVSVEATFDGGSVLYSVLSFTPGLPFQQGAENSYDPA